MTGAAGAPDAVNVVFCGVRQFEVDDVREFVNIEAARGDVSRHQHAQAPLLE